MPADIQELSKNLKSPFCKYQNCNYLFGYQRKSAFICVQLPFSGLFTAEDAEERQARTATALALGLNPKIFQPPAPSLFTLCVLCGERF